MASCVMFILRKFLMSLWACEVKCSIQAVFKLIYLKFHSKRLRNIYKRFVLPINIQYLD